MYPDVQVTIISPRHYFRNIGPHFIGDEPEYISFIGQREQDDHAGQFFVFMIDIETAKSIISKHKYYLDNNGDFTGNSVTKYHEEAGRGEYSIRIVGENGFIKLPVGMIKTMQPMSFIVRSPKTTCSVSEKKKEEVKKDDSLILCISRRRN